MHARNPSLVLVLVLTAAVTTASLACGRQPDFQPVEVGNGPLLFFTHHDLRPDGWVDTTYVMDPTIHRQPVLLLKDWQVHPQHRFRSDLVLVEYRSRLLVLNLRSGKASFLLPENKTQFVSVAGSRVFFVELLPAGGDKSRGVKLGGTGKGVTTTEEYYRGPENLYVADVEGSAKPQRILDHPIEGVLSTTKEAIWLVSTEPKRKLIRVTHDNQARDIVPFDSHWVTTRTKCAFSPHGRYLALETVHDAHDFNKERELFVIDVQQRKITWQQERISTAAWSGWGHAPHLSCRWRDEKTLFFRSFPKWDLHLTSLVDIEAGKFLSDEQVEKWQKLLEKESSKPARRRRIGYFELEFGKAFFAGDGTPAVNVVDESKTQVRTQVGEMEVSPGGEYLLYRSRADHHVYLLDGAKRTETRITPAGVGYSWLPAVQTSPKK